MSLKRIEITGYRGFKEKHAIDFAIPNGEPGSGLTLITGPNNAGKSSILECLRARQANTNLSFSTGTRNNFNDFVDFKYFINDKQETIKSISKGSSEVSIDIAQTDFQIFVLPSRRAFNTYFNKGLWDRDTYQKYTELPSQRSSVLTHFEYRLFNILKNPSQFNELLFEALGFKPNWTIDKSDHGTYFLKFFKGTQSHSSDGLGEGIISLFAIIDSLYDSLPGGVIAIDEPELSLHPSLQKRVSVLLRRYAKDRQIIVSTHSPYFIDLHGVNNGGQIVRVTATDSGTHIHQLLSESSRCLKLLSNGLNNNNPHVFGLDAKELFFQEERIILTEGQEDVISYPIIAEQLGVQIDGNFFGWGVGGASNIKYLCTILKDLGFQRVAAILDGDKIKEVTELKKEFPNYYFVAIPANDIKDKKAQKAKQKVSGILCSNKKIKVAYTDRMREIFLHINEHLAI